LRFWTQQGGFTVTAGRDMGAHARWVEVAPSRAASALVLYPKAMMAEWESRRPSVVFTVDDIQSTCARLAAKDVTFARELASLPWGRFASFLDTEGNEFGLRE
jgi:lactoylglutathione lyase